MVSYAPYFISTVVYLRYADDLHESGYRRFQYDLKSFGHGADGFPLQTEMV